MLNDLTILQALRGEVAVADVCSAAGIDESEFRRERDALLRRRLPPSELRLRAGVTGARRVSSATGEVSRTSTPGTRRIFISASAWQWLRIGSGKWISFAAGDWGRSRQSLDRPIFRPTSPIAPLTSSGSPSARLVGSTNRPRLPLAPSRVASTAGSKAPRAICRLSSACSTTSPSPGRPGM